MGAWRCGELRSPEGHRGHGGPAVHRDRGAHAQCTRVAIRTAGAVRIPSTRGSVAFAGALVIGFALSACGDRRDVADVAVGVAPFDQLRGMDIVQLRSGGVRALRRGAEPSPFEGLREAVGAFDVVYAVDGFDGSDGAWPSEDASIMSIEGTREWPSDPAARKAWEGTLRAVTRELAAAPTCAAMTGPGFTLRVAEWDRGNGWSLSASLAPSVVLGEDTLSARHSIAVRREALTRRYSEHGNPNPDARPTWTREPCLAVSAP